MTVVRKINFEDFPPAERDWSAHRDGHWLLKAINPHHPPALRVYFAALGRRKVGGHAPFDGGELAEILVSDRGVLPDRRRVAEAIRMCVHWGYLAEGSNALCLVVPPDDIRGGRGAEYRCRRGHGRRLAQAHAAGCACARCSKVSVQARTRDPEVSAPDKDTSTPSVRLDADTLSARPLSLLPTATPDDGEATA